jgi:hypothetical protein
MTAMTRAVMLLVFAFLTGALAVGGIACESSPVDVNFGTDAGADFDAPPRDARADIADADEDGG